MEPDLIHQFAQFGLAGLMGALWFMERRHSSQRERELSQAHERLVEQRLSLEELLRVVRDNTTVLTALERSQSRLINACERIANELARRAEVE